MGGVVSIPRSEHASVNDLEGQDSEPISLAQIVAGGALLAGGFLLLANYRRSGLVVTVAGTALALLDQQEVVRTVWNRIPDYVDEVQTFVGRVQEKVDEFAAKRESLDQALSGASSEG